jgi:hypothetical protein
MCESEGEGGCKLVVGFGQLNLSCWYLEVGFGRPKLIGCERTGRKTDPLDFSGWVWSAESSHSEIYKTK